MIAQVNLPGKNFAARTTIQVGSSNIEGISLTVRGGVPVNGRVRVEGETTASLTGLRVTLQPAEAGHRIRSVPDPAGQGRRKLSIRRRRRGSLHARGQQFARGLLSQERAFRQSRCTGRRPGDRRRISCAAGHGGEFQGRAGFRYGAGSEDAEGSGRDDGGAGSPGEGAAQSESFYRSATTDAAGGFTFKSLTPGEYRVYSWEEAEYGAWMDPDFMKPLESRGEAVSIQEGGRQPFR